MPASNFNSAERDSARFWIRSAAGWDYFRTRGYDFVRYVQQVVGHRPSGTLGAATADAMAEYLLGVGGPVANSLRTQLVSSTFSAESSNDTSSEDTERRRSKRLTLAAIWIFAHYNDPGRLTTWPMPDTDIFIPRDTVLILEGLTLPGGGHDNYPHVTLAGRGAPVPPGLSAEQAAPVTVVDANQVPVPSSSIAPSVIVQTSSGPRAVAETLAPVLVSTSSGTRYMPVSSPPVRAPPPAGIQTKTVLLVVGGVILLGGVAYALTKYSQPVTRSRSHARGR